MLGSKGVLCIHITCMYVIAIISEHTVCNISVYVGGWRGVCVYHNVCTSTPSTNTVLL